MHVVEIGQEKVLLFQVKLDNSDFLIKRITRGVGFQSVVERMQLSSGCL